MTVRILTRRVIPANREIDIMPFLKQLRALASMEPGYISGETLRNDRNSSDYLAISTWKSVEDWKRWVQNIERKGLHDRINSLLDSEPVWEVFRHE